VYSVYMTMIFMIVLYYNTWLH